MFTGKWRTKKLTCPVCGGEITALPGDRAFACTRCEQGFEISGGRVGRLSANQVYRGWWLRARPGGPAGEGAGNVVLLPFWRFELTSPAQAFTLRETGRVPPKVRKSMRDEERFDLSRHRVFAYYPAFRTEHAQTAFDLAATLTDSQPAYELSAGAYSAGAVHASDAAERGLHFASEHLRDRSPGLALTGLCGRRSPQLVSLPFERRGGELVEGVSGARFPAGEVDEQLLGMSREYRSSAEDGEEGD
jgi:ribosomal protein S27AE